MSLPPVLTPEMSRQFDTACEQLMQHSAKADDAPVLLVLSWGKLGDLLQISPLLHQLRRRFATARIVLVSETSYAMTMLRSSPDVDGIIALAAAQFQSLQRRAEAERWVDLQVHCRYVVQYRLPAHGREKFSAIEQAFVDAASARVSTWLPYLEQFPSDNDLLWREAARQGLSMYGLMAWTAGFEHIDFEQQYLFLAQADFDAIPSALPERYVTVANAAELLPASASGWTKCLPADKMDKIITQLHKRGLSLVQLGVLEDPKLARVDFDLRGKSTPTQAAAILKRALFHLGPEGGLTNIANAVGTRSIVFFGSTPPEFFAFRRNRNVLPIRCGSCWWITSDYLYSCPRLLARPECTASISETEILREVDSLLCEPAASWSLLSCRSRHVSCAPLLNVLQSGGGDWWRSIWTDTLRGLLAQVVPLGAEGRVLILAATLRQALPLLSLLPEEGVVYVVTTESGLEERSLQRSLSSQWPRVEFLGAAIHNIPVPLASISCCISLISLPKTAQRQVPNLIAPQGAWLVCHADVEPRSSGEDHPVKDVLSLLGLDEPLEIDAGECPEGTVRVQTACLRRLS